MVENCKKPSQKQSLSCSRIEITVELWQQQSQFLTQILRDLSNLKNQIKKERIKYHEDF
jgi:hypothetical protein